MSVITKYSTRSIFPGFGTNYDLSSHNLSEEFFDNQSFDNVSIFADDIEIQLSDEKIIEQYLQKNYSETIMACDAFIMKFQRQEKNVNFKKKAIGLTHSLASVRMIKGLSLVNLSKKAEDRQQRNKYLEKAVDIFKIEHIQIETDYRKGMRLNNLGCCYYLLQKYQQSFKCFFEAQPIFHRQQKMNYYGLCKNISLLYKAVQNYTQALQLIYRTLFEFESNNTLVKIRSSLSEYQKWQLIISLFQCINEIQRNEEAFKIFWECRSKVEDFCQNACEKWELKFVVRCLELKILGRFRMNSLQQERIWREKTQDIQQWFQKHIQKVNSLEINFLIAETFFLLLQEESSPQKCEKYTKICNKRYSLIIGT